MTYPEPRGPELASAAPTRPRRSRGALRIGVIVVLVSTLGLTGLLLARSPGTTEQFIDDTLEVTDYLRERFNQDKIYILAHSWGSLIALQAAARSPARYKAYLGVGQIVHQLESEKIAYDYMLAAYRECGDAGMVRKLEAAPVTMSGERPKGT